MYDTDEEDENEEDDYDRNDGFIAEDSEDEYEDDQEEASDLGGNKFIDDREEREHIINLNKKGKSRLKKKNHNIKIKPEAE